MPRHATQNLSPRRRRRGTTLAESMIASVLLATCVVSIAGALSASYQNQNFAAARRAASVSGRKLMENALSMPLDPATAGQASLSDYQQAQSNTTTSTSALAALLQSLTFNLVRFPTITATTTTASATTTTPTINVDRRASLNGTSSATGDFAVVTVTVQTPTSATSTANVQFKRLVTSVEATANQAR